VQDTDQSSTDIVNYLEAESLFATSTQDARMIEERLNICVVDGDQ